MVMKEFTSMNGIRVCIENSYALKTSFHRMHIYVVFLRFIESKRKPQREILDQCVTCRLRGQDHV